jgi:hypothetical protein
MKFRLGTAGIVIALLAPPQLSPQTTKRTTASVPFVGCGSYGMINFSKAPKGVSKSVSINLTEAQTLAYYKSADGSAFSAHVVGIVRASQVPMALHYF